MCLCAYVCMVGRYVCVCVCICVYLDAVECIYAQLALRGGERQQFCGGGSDGGDVERGFVVGIVVVVVV